MLNVREYNFSLLGDALKQDSIEIMDRLAEAYDKLYQKNPNHELLGKAPMDKLRTGFNITPEFMQLYVKSEDKRPIDGFKRYLSALELALQQ